MIFGVAIGGALGASARYGVDRLIQQRTTSVFPFATFTINITGCFTVGLITAALVDRHHLPAWLRVGLVLGVVGGYTTFSTFAQEAFDLETGHLVVTLTYVVASVALGIAAVAVGMRAGRLI